MKNIITEAKKLSSNIHSLASVKELFKAAGGKGLDELPPGVMALLVDAAHLISTGNETGEKLKPAPDYNGLLKQFNSLINLNRSLRHQASFYRRNAENNSQNVGEIQQLYKQIDSERSANALLTDEICQLNEALQERDRKIAASEAQSWGSEQANAPLLCSSNGTMRENEDVQAALSYEREQRRKLESDNANLRQQLRACDVRISALEQYQLASPMLREHCERRKSQ
ncbi:hypothetical protein AGJ34_20775 [Cronobacter dublinensis subsp. dublinensis]|nr:hypothetical protein [Cronobacter dublinensis subsp. dublinensis]EGT5729697.1 hypothetical protein [Cronobacter dublinensis subsp. dublinensis]